MSDSKYSALPPAATLTGAEIFAVAQAGNSVRTTVSAVQNNALGTYTAPGIGAVAQTVAAKLAQTVSVMDFGAKGDGSTNDTAAFAAATATGQTIYVPYTASFYVVTALTPSQEALLWGPGIIKMAGVVQPISPPPFLYPQTAAETAASVTPTFYFYPLGDIRRYGADPNNGIDSTTPIQNALNVCANGGAKPEVPPGTYKYSALLVPSGVSMTGKNKATSILNCTTTTGNAISVTNSLAGLVLSALTLATVSPRTAGATIACKNSHNVRISEVVFSGVHSTCIDLDGGAQQFETYIDHIDIATPNCTIGISITGATGAVQDTFIDHVELSTCTDTGLKIINATGGYVHQASIFSCGNGISFVPGNAQLVADFFFDTVLADTCTGSGWNFSPAAGASVIGIYLTNCWGSSQTNSAGSGFVFQGAGQLFSIGLTNCTAFNNAGLGYNIANGRFITLTNCRAEANSQSGVNAFAGLLVGSVTDVQIIGGVYGGIQTIANKQSVGISLGASCDYIQILGTNLRNNGVGPLSNASTGTHNLIRDNAGYNPIGQTLVTVTASPFSWTNITGAAVVVCIGGGTVSNIAIGGGLVMASATNTSVVVPPGATLVVTYTVAPTFNYLGT